MEPFRVEPNLPAAAYKTYQIAAPVQTHRRPATCADAGCQHYLNGWQTIVDESVELGQGQAHYIRHDAGRKFVESRGAWIVEDDDHGAEVGRRWNDQLTTFEFEAGQACFRASTHTVPLDRPAIYVVRDGDHRGNPRGTDARVHVRPDDWVDDFATHQDRLATRLERG